MSIIITVIVTRLSLSFVLGLFVFRRDCFVVVSKPPSPTPPPISNQSSFNFAFNSHPIPFISLPGTLFIVLFVHQLEPELESEFQRPLHPLEPEH